MSHAMSAPRTPPANGLRQFGALVAFIILCLFAGWLGTLATTPNIATWYAALEKPSFTPPDGVFPVAWGILYLLMALAAWLVWRAPYRDAAVAPAARWRALAPFFVQLVLNVLWSFAFFGAHSPLLGLVVIVLLIAAICWTIARFWPISGASAVLLVPYLAWVCFATALNAAILALN
jgi:tryptophan-rich sensory protein